METLTVTSPAFEEGGWIPRVHTGRGEDRSPALWLAGLSPAAVSLAVTLDDDSHPIFPHYNHWAAWNLPAAAEIPAAIPAGRRVETLGRAMQGIAYGRHRYKGPKPPLRWLHSYTFTVYVLDCFLDLSPASRKADLLTAMEGHVLQRATLSGKYQNGRGSRRPAPRIFKRRRKVMKNAACLPAKKIAAAYRARVDAPSFSGEIDKELYTEHDAAFMDEIEMFFTAALSD